MSDLGPIVDLRLELTAAQKEIERLTIEVESWKEVARTGVVHEHDKSKEIERLQARVEELEGAIRENGNAFASYGDHVRQAGCYAIAIDAATEQGDSDG